MVIYIAINAGDPKCSGVQYFFGRKNLVLPRKQALTPKTAIPAMFLKLHVTTCLSLP